MPKRQQSASEKLKVTFLDWAIVEYLARKHRSTDYLSTIYLVSGGIDLRVKRTVLTLTGEHLHVVRQIIMYVVGVSDIPTVYRAADGTVMRALQRTTLTAGVDVGAVQLMNLLHIFTHLSSHTYYT